MTRVRETIPGKIRIDTHDNKTPGQQVLHHIGSGGSIPMNVGKTGTEPTTLRHTEEKERLLKRLDKSHGNYNIHHPRWRLLKTLWSFSKYRDFSKSEVKRWRDLYKNTSKQQRKVRTRLLIQDRDRIRSNVM